MEELDEQTANLLDAIMEEQHREIPENSPTLLVSENTSRFNGADWFEKIIKQKILLAGVGGIGSWVALLLSRLQVCRITLFDDDIVEGANMSGQLYSTSDIGSSKVNAVRNTMRAFSNYYSVNAHLSRYDENSYASDIMICGFDNMAARKVFFNNWVNYLRNYAANKKECLYIDGRLNAEEFQIFAIQGDNEAAIKEYAEKWLFDDSEVEEAVCSYKQTSFMACMIASYMVNIFVNFVANLCDPIFPRDVPFFTSYSADTMYNKMITV